MHFDDRLGTVLRLRAESQAVQRIQYRQLLDLLGVAPVEMHGERLDAAFARLGELGAAIPAPERAAMIADRGVRLRSPRLIAAIAGGEPAVARAALFQADLSLEQWLDLIPALPAEARVHLRGRRSLPLPVIELLEWLGANPRGLPEAPCDASAALIELEAATVTAASFPQSERAIPLPPAQAGESAVIASAQPESEMAIPLPAAPAEQSAGIAPAPSGDRLSIPLPPFEAGDGAGIGAIVRRIEAYRRAREESGAPPPADSPRLPLGEEQVPSPPKRARAFDFATNVEGRVTWADAGVAAMVVGLRLGGDQARGSASLGATLRRRLPIREQAVVLNGAPAIAGEWCLDATPWFDPLTGRYIGHRGRMRRAASEAALAPAKAPAASAESGRIRQLLHELRTPVNAIQGYAEVIQQQLFGPTPHEYRAFAAGIAGDAARMLSAFEELERLARLDSKAMELVTGQSDLAAIVEAIVAQLDAHVRQRGGGFALFGASARLPVGLERLEIERIAWRLLATLAGVSAPGEVLEARLARDGDKARLDLALPAALAVCEDEALFHAAASAFPQVIAAGVFGVGFALRLARAEAEAGGGKLVRAGPWLRLSLPAMAAGELENDGNQGQAQPGEQEPGAPNRSAQIERFVARFGASQPRESRDREVHDR